MKKLDKIIDSLLSIVSTICYFSLIIVVLMQIGARYIPSLTLSWTEELSRFFFVFIISFGAPLSYKYKAYADVDLIYERFNDRTKIILDFIGGVIVLIFSTIVMISGYRFILIGTRSVSPALQWPMKIHHSTISIFAVGTIFYCLLTLGKMIISMQNKNKKMEGEVNE